MAVSSGARSRAYQILNLTPYTQIVVERLIRRDRGRERESEGVGGKERERSTCLFWSASRSSVVLPAPRKPDSKVMGTFLTWIAVLVSTSSAQALNYHAL